MVRISSTIGPVDAGIIPMLARTYEGHTGAKIEIEKAGTWATLENAKTGNFDLVIVHARQLEEQFIADGYGMDRRDIMYNDFVILGPKTDPAGIRGMTDATAAFEKIAASKACFVTRGDKSGTHVKEMEIWEKTGIFPESSKDKWYITFEGGNLGNGPTTLYSNKINAYTLMDRATFLIKKSSINLVLLLEKDTTLLNFFATVIVNPQKFPNVNASGAKTFVDWLCGYEAQSIIKDFEIHKYNEPLFFPNSDEWNRQCYKCLTTERTAYMDLPQDMFEVVR